MRKFQKILSYIILAGATIASLMGCLRTQQDSEREGVSVAQRGESLKEFDGAPVAVDDPVVLPAIDPETDEESISSVMESIDESECKTTQNLLFEGRVVELVNSAREYAGVPPLGEHALLTQVARRHSQGMACGNSFGHSSPDLGTVDRRLTSEGYSYSAVGENIAYGYFDPEGVVSAWMDSQAHRENLLSIEFTRVGIGYAQAENEEDQGAYWTIILAAP
jgi:uncharacterized protein YkwD